MASGYHAGEIEVQARAGVLDSARRMAGSVRAEIPPPARAFLAERRIVVVATVDADGRPWASILTGKPGFAQALDEQTVRLSTAPAPGDPLVENLATSMFLGLIAPDFATRRRMRVNGRLDRDSKGAILLRADQVYSNCPKYIQRREGEAALSSETKPMARRLPGLEEQHRRWIRGADTFFVATVHPESGADASHRGGMPGFVSVDGDRITWPDYAGNTMFNTLGNIAAYPRAGLVFPNFDTGAVLQFTGRAAINWDPTHVSRVAGAERLVAFEVEEAVEIVGALPLGLRLVDYSKFNPKGVIPPEPAVQQRNW
mgnify:FL=1